MNVYILTDMEGISLITEWEQVDQKHPHYAKYQSVLTLEVAAAVEGAIAAGAKRIVVNDGHGSKDYIFVGVYSSVGGNRTSGFGFEHFSFYG